MEPAKADVVTALGVLVKARRAAANISQEELADRAHLDRTYISGIERGVRNPSLTALATLARGFGVSLSDLVAGLETKAGQNA